MNSVRVNLFTPQQALDAVLARLGQACSFTLYTLNLDHVVKLRANAEFQQAYADADFVSADGWPIVWHFRRLGVRLRRTTGADILAPLCEKAAERGVPVFFIGPQDHVQRRALAMLKQRYPALVVAGADASIIDPEDTKTMDALAQRVSASGARLCFVCLGAPKQELVASALKSRCSGVGFLCVGAALDFLSGTVRRAPPWVQSAGMEWAWRLTYDPLRLAPRYLRCAEVFLLIALRRLPLVFSAQPASGS